MRGLVVRRLRPGEDDLWHRCGLDGRSGTGKAFTHQGDFRTEAHLVALRDGEPAGRVESLLMEPHRAILVDPLVVPGETVLPVADALIEGGLGEARALGVARIVCLLQSRLPYLAMLQARSASWGFEPVRERRLYRLNACPPPGGTPVAGLHFTPMAAFDDSLAVGLLERILTPAEGPATELLAELADRVRHQGQTQPEDWEIGWRGDEPVGIVLPGLVDASSGVGTILYLGVVPEARGAELGPALARRGLHRLAARHQPPRFLGSTDAGNGAMVRIFEKLGYEIEGQQFFYRHVG